MGSLRINTGSALVHADQYWKCSRQVMHAEAGLWL